jgi:cytoskeletal protein CcmA (bactofilin family)
MFRKQPSKPQNRIDSLIGAGTRIEGNVKFSGGLRVDGEVVGNVTAVSDQPSTLVVSEQARIEGEISVSHLVVNGEISGPVHVGEFLELQSRSRVKGDVHYNSLEMHLGAVVEGRLIHGSSEAKSVELKLAASKPTV